jgi:hypothetical protein
MPRGDFIKADLLNQAFILCPAKMQTYMNVLSEGAIRTEEIGVANNNVVYTVVDNVAIIAIDGAMYKKEFRGACGEVGKLVRDHESQRFLLGIQLCCKCLVQKQESCR